MHHGSYRDTWTEISLDAIEQNVKAFHNYIPNDCHLMAVVKADGYGHGAVEIAKKAIKSGASYLGVAFLDEAIQLRNAGIEHPILLLGYTAPDAIATAIENNLTVTVFSTDVIMRINELAEHYRYPVRVHLKIDSGMHRVGVKTERTALELIQQITSEYVLLEGIFTHFADADNPDSADYTWKQFNHFKSVVDYLEQHNVDLPIKHCCNSAGTIAYPEMHLDMVRVGISLYGLYPSDHLKEKIALKQAMRFQTKPSMIKTVNAGEPISYGCSFAPDAQATIVTVPVGYADGLSRLLSNQGNMTVNGKKAPIVGKVCMDQTMIDATGIEPVSKDDVVTIFGDPGDGFISMGEVADQMQTIHYETACLIDKRVPRLYRENGKIVYEKGLI